MGVPKVRWTASNEDATNVGNPLFGTSLVQGFAYEALLVSEPHHRLPSGGWSGGGPFYAYSLKTEHSAPEKVRVRYVCGDFGEFTIRGVLPYVPMGKPVSVSYPTWTEQREAAEPYYATGYARTRPGNPVAGLGQFLVELRDLPSIPFGSVLGRRRKGSRFGVHFYPFHEIPGRLLARLKDFRSLGSEYLNIVFGWKPFVNDLRKMYYLWQAIDKRMAQIIRDNGRNITHKATLEDSTSVTQEQHDYATPYVNVLGSPPNWWPGSTQWTYQATTKTRVWFSGSYRYYIPDVSSSLWNARARSALFGAHVTPELLWNVLPWSWLVDWFGNVGDVMSNASENAVDNLVTNYAFTMRQVTVEKLCQAHVSHGGSQDPCFTWPAMDHSFTSKSIETTKVRVGGGNPFGLNVKLESLTPYQSSILAALGISRSRVR